MNILHTGDWHLGKTLEGFSRLEEQELFLDDFVRIAEENCIDLVIIAGDIYDSFNPSAKAEKMFYDTLKRLSDDGKRLTLVIAGNHDSPDRLVAAGPLARDHGIIMMGTPKTVVEPGIYGQHQILKSEEGFIEIEINGEKAVIVAVAFPSEKRLNEVLYTGMDSDEEKLASYEDRMKLLFNNLEKNYRADAINLLVSHLFVMGSVESGSERSIQLGGSYLINSAILPEAAQYIALGHVHKPQVVPGSKKRARYSGSPIHYSKNEINYQKSLVKISVAPMQKPVIEEIPLKTYKPIELWQCDNLASAKEKCEENSGRDCWIYLEIKTDQYLKENQIKELKDLKKDIISIRPITPEEIAGNKETKTFKERAFDDLFRDFYFNQRGIAASQETMDMIMSLVYGEDEYETD
ncbi:MAG: exonuclease SbcCD subunit D [Eubacteriales bacterium]|nr:exonuclease SbcCD subunit D [Eubacteriales bacterium]